MSNTNDLALVYTTFANTEDARRIGTGLLEDRLAACVNIFPAITSLYEWRGKIQHDTEVAMIIKTRKALVDRLMTRLKKRHPYETPALLVLDVPRADADYCAWIMAQTDN